MSRLERIRRRALLEAWYQGNWPDLYRYVYHHVQNREEAEDLAQEAFSRTLAHHADGELPTRQYLYATAMNLIRDRWRRRRRSGVALPLEEALLGQKPDDEAMQVWIRELLDQLPQEYRVVLELRIIQGYSRTETAQRLDKSESAVRSLQYRALQLLRAKLSQGEVDGR